MGCAITAIPKKKKSRTKDKIFFIFLLIFLLFDGKENAKGQFENLNEMITLQKIDALLAVYSLGHKIAGGTTGFLYSFKM
jgi:hypothetical protein